ncbi:MAG: hypothetical protein R3B91_10170 [Planctomycetaceae bacterium]
MAGPSRCLVNAANRKRSLGPELAKVVTALPPPSWIAELARSVTTVMHAQDVLAPIGCHYHLEDGVWEVTIFASKTEVVGGEQDGLRFPSRFVLDLKALLDLFSSVEAVEWQALPHGPDDEFGANVAIVGTYQGGDVCLRIPAEAPQRFEVGRLANVYEMRFVDIW